MLLGAGIDSCHAHGQNKQEMACVLVMVANCHHLHVITIILVINVSSLSNILIDLLEWELTTFNRGCKLAGITCFWGAGKRLQQPYLNCTVLETGCQM
jgi:hypothetical protein